MKWSPYYLVAAAIVLGSGCRSQQLAKDQDHIRCAVMQLQENQLMDNLVRARKGLPILHLDYSNMTGTITQTGSAMGGANETTASNTFLNIPASASAIARTVTGVGTWNAGAMQVSQLTITAQPVTNAPEVYTAYLTFLKEPDHLRETCAPPSCEEALLVRCYTECADDDGCYHAQRLLDCCKHGGATKKTYYWVPRVYADEFRKLALYAVAVRGQPVALLQNFDATVLGVTKQIEIDPNNFELYLKIDPKIPNDRGYMVATIDGRVLEDPDLLKVLINPDVKRAQPGTVLEPDQQTSVVRLSVNLKSIHVAKIEELIKALSNQKVSFRLNNFVPTGNPTDRVLQDVRMQTELLRLGQLQPRNP